MKRPAKGKTPESGPSKLPADDTTARPAAPAAEWPDKRGGLVTKTAKIVLTVAGIGVALAVAYILRHFILVLFLGVVVAASLYPAASWLERKRFPRWAAVLAPYVAVVAFFVLAGFLIFPPLVEQVRQLIDDLPSLIDRFREWAGGLMESVGIDSGEDVFGRISSEIGNFVPNIGGLLQIPLTVISAIADVTIVVVTSFLMLLERSRIRRWTLRFLPHDTRQPFLHESEKSLQKVGRFVLGQLIVMAVIGVGTGVGMFVLGIPFALPIGLLGFLGEIVPFIGPIVAGVPAAILGFISSPLDGLIMTGWLLALQALESYVLSPAIQHKVLRVSPLAVVVVVVVALTLFGILGALVAVPIVAIVDVLLEDVIFPMRERREQARANG